MFRITAARLASIIIYIWLTVLSQNGSAQPARPGDFYQGATANPLIQAMLDSVSTDSIFANLERLVSFHTRHINSDTSSPDTGIGAARNFILSKFQRYAAGSSGGLQASFFVFPATVCGVFNPQHKNVLATIPGTLTPERHFIVSGHMDSRNINNCDPQVFAPGANDDGSGTAVSLEMARVLSQFAGHLESTLSMMAVTGEEQGLIGSSAYADWALANNLRIDGMITNDIVGNIRGCEDPACPGGNFIIDSTSVRHFSGPPATSSSRQLARYIKLKAEQYVTEVPWKVNLIPALDRPGRGGDHIPFFENGYAAVRFTEPHENGDGSGNNGQQHNGMDSLQFVNIPYVARIVKTNMAGLACLAMAPATPAAPITVQDVGNGTDLLLSWTVTNNEPDFAGYRIAWRHPDSLSYQQIVAAGNVTQFTLTGLTPEQPVYLGYSALDNHGNESIFSQEVLATPAAIPAAPQGFDATSTAAGVQLTWEPNRELDLAGYTITRTDPNSIVQEFLLDASAVSFFDNTLQPHLLYRYHIVARDLSGNQSAPSATVRGQLPTHDLGILILDATRDGPGGNPLFPTDEMVDSFYDNILAGFNIAGQWDIADSLQLGLALSDAHMAPYSTVILHSDVRLPTHKIAEDTSALRKFIQNGGRMAMSGWQLLFSVADNALPLKMFQPGDFVYDYMKIDTAASATSIDFRGADPAPGAGSYPAVTVDSAKIPTFGGNLNAMEIFQSLTGGPQTEAVYTYRSSQQPPSQFHGQPVALRHISSDLGIIVFDLPLYYMWEAEAAGAITSALIELGEVTGIEDGSPEPPAISRQFDLGQNYPNPFNPATVINYQLPDLSRVILTIYNILGQKVKTLVNQKQSPGSYTVEWDGKDEAGKVVSSGVYLYWLRATSPSNINSRSTGEPAPRFSKVKKLILIR
jgi:hypothetical protein